jgi:hypothetical protein
MAKHQIQIENIKASPLVEHLLASAHGKSEDKELLVETNVITSRVTFIVKGLGYISKFSTIERAVTFYNNEA